METKKVRRDSNFELLRIVAMALIIICHYESAGQFWGTVNGVSVEPLELTVLRLGGKAGVVIFGIITGYFTFNKAFKWQKIRDVSLQTSWYSLVMLLFVALVVQTPITKMMVVKSVFPLMMSIYWYATAFVIMLLLSPAINVAMKSFAKRETTYVLGILLLFMGLPIMTRFHNDVTGLILAYAIGAYIKRFDITISRRWIGVLLFVTLGAALGMTVLFTKGASISSFFASNRLSFVTGFNINAYALGTLLFLFAKETKIGQISAINWVASTTFGIYLFHCYPFYQGRMWYQIAQIDQLQGVSVAVSLLVSVVGIFIVGMILDFIRQCMFKTVQTLWGMIARKKSVKD